MLSSDIYNEGWIFTLQPTNWKRDIIGFYFAEEATTWITNELQRMKDFLSVALSKHANTQHMVIFQEGGELQMNPLAGMEPEIWNDFQKEFLD